MALGDRIQTILKEKGLNQRQFAESIFATNGYISRLLKDHVGMSNSTAMLVEKVHGYAKDWVLHGTGPKRLEKGEVQALTALQKGIIVEIERMSDDELFFMAVYIEAVKKKKALERKKAENSGKTDEV
jgi:transcriptional regulator with XRE-family HTH domain